MAQDYVKVGEVDDIHPSQTKAVQVGSDTVCVVNIDGKFYAIDNTCTHMGGPLAEGQLEGYEIRCPWHGSKFDVRTGQVTKPPAATPEPIYEVKIDNKDILIRKQN
jgi:glycine betaine catabolism B